MSRHRCYRLELQGSCLSTELWTMPPKFLITAAKSLLPMEGKISPVSEDGRIGILEGGSHYSAHDRTSHPAEDRSVVDMN